jgi:tetratricopeptide (TPR) repeat protein
MVHDPKSYPEVQEAVRLLADKLDIDGAIKKLEDAEYEHPEIPSAPEMIHQLLDEMFQPTAVRGRLEDALKADPGNPEPWVVLGTIALLDQRFAEAELDFTQAQQLLPSYTNTQRKQAIGLQMHSGLAQVAEIRGRWNVAEAHLREMSNMAPDDSTALQRLARSLFWQGMTQEAYDILKKAKAFDREDARKNRGREGVLNPPAILAQWYDQYEGAHPGRNNSSAAMFFRYAIKIAPDDLPTRQAAAIWALENGDIAFAREQAEAALRIEKSDGKTHPWSTVGHMLRGVVALWEKDWPTAEDQLGVLINQCPNDFAAKNNLALALVEQNDPRKKRLALEFAEAYSESYPNNPDALSTLGWVHYRRNEFDKAAAALDQAAKAFYDSGKPIDPDTVTYRAHVLYQQGKKWEAKEVLEKIWKPKLESAISIISSSGGAGFRSRPPKPFRYGPYHGPHDAFCGALPDCPAFAMKPESQALYEKVKEATKPEAAGTEKTP